MRNRKLILVTLLLCVAGAAFAATSGVYWRIVRYNAYFRGDLAYSGATQQEIEATAVGLTSPTVTFSVANLGAVTLTSDANLSGIKPTGGRTNQLLWVFAGAGSNTMQFDDSGTTMALGGNITLTEGQSDALLLRCTDAVTNNWQCLIDRSGN